MQVTIEKIQLVVARVCALLGRSRGFMVAAATTPAKALWEKSANLRRLITSPYKRIRIRQVGRGREVGKHFLLPSGMRMTYVELNALIYDGVLTNSLFP